MKLHRFGPTVAIAMAASLTLAACGDDAPTTSSNEGSDEGSDAGSEEGGETLSGDLLGSGASSQEAAMTAWIAGYQGTQPEVTVQYNSVGSGAGRENLIAGASDFIGSDAYLDEEEREAVTDTCGDGGAVHVPVYISPVAVAYNLPGVDGLQLSPDTLAQIMNQDITTWDDAAIAEDNPDAELPDTEITVVHRSDDSGTTENFMEYLTAAAPDSWPHEPSDAWPVPAEAAAQNTGVIQVINDNEGTIGYADASVVTGQSAAIGVGEEFVTFSPEAAANVVDASEPADTGVEGDMALELARDTTESGTYPIVLVSYHIACTSYDDPERANLVKDFLSYVVSEEGQQAASDAAGSAPISEDTRTSALELIDTIQGG
ncbi:phosphate ABC transporter substrate-binding protein PstS [Serinicoccus sp. CNJ-927]|uniref:phosphate ABC transporter substrate-binding protein PstS n=1 Tax=Serinicoccus sp. CNJ-927 TaxID=1904970 RepID=UPI0009699888|nr:phosphate ABC transporter substrate-binding protein PstS [Serinicoccus sp. CNJ-927]OLT44779.1 phosphate ABC transporter substrate-binding protein PstS [Serinicoccus sp. CNJ-927]